MNFQWYPGHMTKAKRQMQEDIKLIDLVIELIDSRIPFSSRNPDIDELAKGKARLILLNKTDLADAKVTDEWAAYFAEKNIPVCKVNSRNNADMKQIEAIVKEASAEKIERDRRRGIKNRPVRAMVVGIPNVGKSTFINTYARKAAAKTGNKPGVTKGKQWIRLSNTLELLDTPGILWPKFEDQSVGLKLALIGSIKDEIMNIEELALELIRMIEERYPDALEKSYTLSSVDGNDLPDEIKNSGIKEVIILGKIAKAKGCIKNEGALDTLRAANMLLENFRNGKIGRLSLERPDELQ
ncbi:MAG: ribosome biogenesis GTPase YlqF [Lachnospiraceae bacterium]|nr:ribosome biogenesis GTPase YlqF [Lachnospiraceae bacterium]